MARPPRLKTISYRGAAAYSLTVCTYKRTRQFVSPVTVDLALAHFLNAAALTGIAVSAYCFMPDHVHLVVVAGVNGDAASFMRRAKQTSGYAHLQLFGQPLWQPGYYDRVLRADADLLECIAYIVANPLRAGLTVEAGAYPFWGSAEYPREEVLDAVAEMALRRGGSPRPTNGRVAPYFRPERACLRSPSIGRMRR